MGTAQTIFNAYPQRDSITIAWLANIASRGNTRPSITTINAVDKFWKTCRRDGNLAIDRFWLFAQDIQANALISLINPTSTSASEVNSPSWSSFQGYTSNGITSYINSNFKPSTDAVTGSLNSFSIGMWLGTNTSTSAVDFGGQGTAASPNRTFCQVRSANTTIYGDVFDNGSDATLGTISTAIGLSVIVRTTANDLYFYKDGSSVMHKTTNVTSTAFTDVNLYMLARNSNGTASNFSDRRMAFAFVSSGAIDQAKWYAACNQLKTDIGF